MKISTTLMIITTVVVLLVVGTSSAVFLISGDNALEEQTFRHLESVTILKNNQLNFYFEEVILDLEVLSDTQEIRESIISDVANDPMHDYYHESLFEYLTTVEERTPHFFEFFIVYKV